MMHNKTNSLMSLIVLLSFMFILNGSAFAASSYLEPVDIPAYNANDSTHVLITPTNGKWSSSILNNPAYTHFYVEPGSYNTRIALSTSGTKDDRRTLSLHNGNDTHPAGLNDNEQANANFDISASYWTIDRMSNLDQNSGIMIRINSNSSYNILNRFHGRKFYYGIYIYEESNYNTVQNSYIENMSHSGRLADGMGLNIRPNAVNGTRVIGTKFVNNDIRNCGDGIHMNRTNGVVDMEYPGTIIDDNRIWCDGDIYTNGDYATNGYNYNGEYMIGEDGIDIKVGSDDPEKPVLVTNNIIWGQQMGDATPSGGITVGPGAAVVIHFGVYNIKFNNNIIFDTQVGLSVGAADNMPYAAKDMEIKNNIFYNMNMVNPNNTPYIGTISLSDSDNITLVNNTIRLTRQNSANSGNALFVNSTTLNSTISNNIFIDTEGTSDKRTNTADENWFYNAAESLGGTNDHIYSSEPEAADMTDYTFQYERFTANPKTKTLNAVISTTTALHYGMAGSLITENILVATEPQITEETIITTEPSGEGHWIMDYETKELIKTY